MFSRPKPGPINPPTPDDDSAVIALIKKETAKIMATLDAITAAVTDLEAKQQADTAALTTLLTDIKAEIAALQASGVDPAALQALTDRVTAVSANLATDTATETAADPGPQPSA